MFDVIPKALASVASFLFPLFASYKALNSADPAQLTPWLMYWVVLSVVVLVESWTDWILAWVPLYYWARLGFLLYLVLPQTQGARVLYQTRLHPFLAQHEAHIDELIGSAHDRLRAAGLAYVQQAIAYAKKVLGLPASPTQPPPPASASSASSASATAAAAAASYTQSLLARFTLPSARWPGGAASASSSTSTSTNANANANADLYSMLATAANGASVLGRGFLGSGPTKSGLGHTDRATFLATQRDRLRSLLSVLDKEAADLDLDASTFDADADTASLSRPLSKSRSDADFETIETIDAESGEEDDKAARARRRHAPVAGTSANPGSAPGAGKRTSSGSWVPWWGGSEADATSSAVDK